MRIAQIATLARPVPPLAEGSVESLVALLTDGLVARGHDVTLYAVADSRTNAALRSPVPGSYSHDPDMWNWELYEAWNAREAFAAWREFDVIHCHSYHFGLLFCDLTPTPSLHSVHIEPGPDYRFLARRTHNRRLHFCSRHQARDFEGVEGVHVVPHGIDLSAYHVAPAAERENYLAFLGRFVPDKGPLEAIAVAQRAGLPIRLAAPATDYFREVIAPLVDGVNVIHVGEVGGEEKAQFLARARALLYPLQRGEPFGLVPVEALASGLPVVALRQGAISEIIDHGATGWLADDEDGLVEGIERVANLDRHALRQEAQARFSARRMVEDLEAVLTATAEMRTAE